MKVCIKSFFLSVLMSLVTLVSCVQEANDGSQRLDGTVADLSGQVASVSSSLEQLNALQNVVEQDLSELSADLEAHIGYLKSGVSRMDGTMATLQLQKEVAMVVAELQAAGFESSMTQFVKSVKSWLGKSFETYFDVLVYGCASQALVEGAALQLSEQHGYIDAVLSDVEAGLRDGVPAEELASVLETLAKNLASATELTSKVDEIVLDLETECAMAVEALFDESSSYDANALKKASTQARIQLKSAEPTISDLVSRIETIESAIETIKTNLSELRADVNELLGMLQSLTFVSEYSDDKAVAYYSMTDLVDSERASEGKKQRVPAATFDLTFLVRPAAVADALAETWQNSLSVIGYYANRIQQQATANIQSFEITNAVSTTGKGLLTVTVKNAFDDEFYFKEKGAMLALAVESGQTNCASKFVEIVPRDETGNIYIESIELSSESLSIKNGDNATLKLTILPENATEKSCVWTARTQGTGATEIITVDQTGNIEAKNVGEDIVEVETVGTDEFGRTLRAECKVNVVESIKIDGPKSVAVGDSIKLELVYNQEKVQIVSVKWGVIQPTNSATYASVREDALTSAFVKGLWHTFMMSDKEYKDVIVTATIMTPSGETYLEYPVKITPIMPIFVHVDGIEDNAKEITMKVGSEKTLWGEIWPEAVQDGGAGEQKWFKVAYWSQNPSAATVGYGNGSTLKAVWVGTATIEFIAAPNDYNLYPGAYFKRYLNVNVEPYWVDKISFNNTYVTVRPGAEPFKVPPIMTSLEGPDPTDQSVIWTLEPGGDDILTITDDGLITIKEGVENGIAVVTVTTNGEYSVPKGQPQKSASVTIQVEKPQAALEVGYYYYSNGTWGPDVKAPDGESVIGVVFAVMNVANAEPKFLGKDFPSVTHGLVVSTVEYSEAFGYIANKGGGNYPLAGEWLDKNGYQVYKTDIPNGYGNTLGWTNYGIYKGDSKNYGLYWAQMFRSDVGVVKKHTSNYTTPDNASPWYVPSYYEMNLLYTNLAEINSKLQNISGASTISNTNYWMSSFMSEDSWRDGYLKPFNMNTGEWGSNITTTETGWNEKRPVRVVLAF